MKIKDIHYYHGAALTQIVEHPAFTALNKADKKYGHYTINHNIRLFVKYSSEDTDCQYTYQPSDLKAISEDISSGYKVFVCLVGGLHNTICILNADQINQVIDLSSHESQTINFDVHQGGSIWARGTSGELKRAVTHNSFPDVMFKEII